MSSMPIPKRRPMRGSRRMRQRSDVGNLGLISPCSQSSVDGKSMRNVAAGAKRVRSALPVAPPPASLALRRCDSSSRNSMPYSPSIPDRSARYWSTSSDPVRTFPQSTSCRQAMSGLICAMACAMRGGFVATPDVPRQYPDGGRCGAGTPRQVRRPWHRLRSRSSAFCNAVKTTGAARTVAREFTRGQRESPQRHHARTDRQPVQVPATQDHTVGAGTAIGATSWGRARSGRPQYSRARRRCLRK